MTARTTGLVPSSIRRLASSPTGQQTLAYVALAVMSSGLAGLTTAVLSRSMSTDGFAGFTLSKSLLLLVASVFEFGIFFPAARLAARSSGEDRRRWIGAMLAAYVPLGAAYVATVALLSLGANSIFTLDIGGALLISAPFAFAYPFSLVAQAISQGTARAYLQPLLGMIAGFLFLSSILIAASGPASVGLTTTLVLRGTAFVVASVAIAGLARPIVGAIRARLKRLSIETREWGLQAYFGRIIGQVTYNLDVVMVGMFADAKQLGAYGLALAGSNLIGLPATGLANVLFQRMATQGTLDTRPMRFVVAFGLVVTVVEVVASQPIIVNYLNPEFRQATLLLIPLGLAATLGAVATLLDAYLSANAAGRELRNTSIILLVANLVLIPALIIPFGASGAALASLGAMTFNLGGYVYYVRRLPATASAQS